MEIDYLEPNKQRLGWVLYVLIIQLIMTVIGITFLGYYIGTKIDPTEKNGYLYIALGFFLGLFMSAVTLIRFLKSEANHER